MKIYHLFYLLFCLTYGSLSLAAERSYVDPKHQKVRIEGESNCYVYFPFEPVPAGLTVRILDGTCSEGWVSAKVRRGLVKLAFLVNGKEYSQVEAFVDYYNHEGEISGTPTVVPGYGSSPPLEWKFSDGEVWEGKWRAAGAYDWYLSKRSFAFEKQEELRKLEYKERARKFRTQLKVGQETRDGLIIEVRGNLVKIQTNEQQCTQRDYNNECRNYVNTSVEKWVKREDIFPLQN